MASQFNLLEMVDPDVTPEHGVTRYEYDPTQGPACAIAAGAGTIWRNYLVPVGDGIGQTADRQLDGLADLGVSLAHALGMGTTPLWQMRNGYALPDADGLARISAHLSSLTESERDALRGRLRLGLHRDVGVTHPEALPDARVTQIYCSALPVAYSTIPDRQWAGFASLVLEAAYEATLLAGLLNAARGASRRVFLTRLGGGAFGNDATWIDSAIIRALRLCEHQGPDVFLVSGPGSSTAARAVEAAWRTR